MNIRCVQASVTYCTTNSTLHHLFLLIIMQLIRIQTVSLPQLIIGNSHSARMNTVLSVNQVGYHTRCKKSALQTATICPALPVSVYVHCSSI